MKTYVLLTCEHAGNEVPKSLQNYFKGSKQLLNSHRGWDFGAFDVAKILEHKLQTKFFYSKVSRLVVDLNRSHDNPTLFSKFIQPLDDKRKSQILKSHYLPYRQTVEAYVTKQVTKTKVAHFSIHSFTPVLKGKVRTCEIGILFDPKSEFEAALSEKLRNNLIAQFPNLRIKMNNPYKGDGDGQTTSLRHKLPKGSYAGIEIEMNKKWLKSVIRTGRLKKTALHIAEAIQLTVT